jgi:glycine/D-amino acid oxidase-like deaminating enzyme
VGAPVRPLAGVNVPLYSAEHFYIVTGKIPGVHPMLPVMRDPDGYIYYKEEVGGLVMGGFEPAAKPWGGPDSRPTSSSSCSAKTGTSSSR